MRKRILPLFAALTLTACASGGTPMPAPTLSPPASYTLECPPLPQPASGELGSLLSNHISVARQYHLCRDRHKALADWLEKTNELR